MFTGVAFAQTEAGSKLVGANLGGANYGQTKSATSISGGGLLVDEDVTTTSYALFVDPNVGWFVKDDLAVGGLVAISTSHFKTEGRGFAPEARTGTATSIELGPFARWYLGGSEHGKPFLEVNATYVFAPARQEGSDFESHSHPKGSYGAGLVVGYEQFVNKSVGIGIASGIDYLYARQETEVSQTFGSVRVASTVTQTSRQWTVPLSIALQIHLP
jgi:hypothetical protein